MDLDKAYREFLSRVHREILKPAGFKKEGGNFRLFHENGLCKIINFQRSLYNDQCECRFAINMGLYIQPDPAKPNLRFKEYECCVRYRAAHLVYRTDYWWCIFEGRDMEKLFSEIQSTLTGSTLPWLEQFGSREDVLHAAQSGQLRGMLWGKI